jgi:hypothetical protein
VDAGRGADDGTPTATAAAGAVTDGGAADPSGGAGPAATGRRVRRPLTTDYGDAWTYESIVGALPGIDLSDTAAVALQVGLFQVGLLLLAWYYDLWGTVLAGTAAVGVAAVGSVAMLYMGRSTRQLELPSTYRRLLFGSSIEVVLSVLSFIALITHLFVFDPVQSTSPLVATFLGDPAPVAVVYFTLLVLWDLCYRIGTSWWTAVVSLWRSLRYRFDPETARSLHRVDMANVGFALVQAALLPFLTNQPVLAVAVGGHVVAVTVVSAAAIVFTHRRAHA